MKRIRMFRIGRVNIELFPGWEKIKQRRISFVLGYLYMMLWKISTAIYLYDFLNQSLGLYIGKHYFIKITACAFKCSHFKVGYFTEKNNTFSLTKQGFNLNFQDMYSIYGLLSKKTPGVKKCEQCVNIYLIDEPLDNIAPSNMS